MLSQVASAIKDFIFPKLCVGCKKPGDLLCPQCFLKVQFIYDQNCPICQHPSIGGLTHPRCKTAWGIDGLTSIAYYRGPIRSLVRQLKYAGATVVSELVDQLLITYQEYESFRFPPGIITAIPLDSQTQKNRGFNQSEILANILSRQLGYPYIPDILQRQNKVISQTKLSKEERRRNMQGAFKLPTKVVASKNLKETTIIVVDDVFTTGATLHEAAKVLKRAGVKRVYGFTLAQD